MASPATLSSSSSLQYHQLIIMDAVLWYAVMDGRRSVKNYDNYFDDSECTQGEKEVGVGGGIFEMCVWCMGCGM